MKLAKSIIGAEGFRILSYLLIWGSGGSLGAGNVRTGVIAAIASLIFYGFSIALDPRK